jgi:hypothetical protein
MLGLWVSLLQDEAVPHCCRLNPLGLPPGRADPAAVGAPDAALGVPLAFGDVAAALADTCVREGDAFACGVSAFGVLGGKAR